VHNAFTAMHVPPTETSVPANNILLLPSSHFKQVAASVASTQSVPSPVPPLAFYLQAA
jgi:hypothetical protein